jgi:S-adenosylmethionine hydrolase
MLTLTLTSDFGYQSHYSSSVKGKILSVFPEIQLVDISHSLKPFQLHQAAYLFRSAYIHFPKGSFHFLLNDLHSDTARHLLYVYENGQHIFCANNGFITLLFDDKPVQIFRLDETLPQYDYLHVCEAFLAHTALLIHGNREGLIPTGVDEIKVLHAAQPVMNGHIVEVQVLYIDPYGNVILNIRQKQFEEMAAGRKFKIRFMKHDEISQIHTSYQDVRDGGVLAFFNTSGHLEIAIRKGHGAQLLGFREQGDRDLIYQTVKIFFE